MVPWTRTGGLRFDPAAPFPDLGDLGFEDAVFLGMVGGSVRAVETDIDRQLLKHTATRDGREPVK